MPKKQDAPALSLDEFASRRQKLRSALKRSVGLIFAGDGGDHLHEDFRPHRHFEYLTGVTDEPGAVLLLDPGHPVPARREVLFLRPVNPELEQWDGHRLQIGQALREQYGLKSLYRLGQLPRFLNEAARRSRSLACLHESATYQEPVSPDLARFKLVAQRIVGIELADQTDEMARLRSVKSTEEVAMIQHAVDITKAGFAAAMESAAPGRSEFQVQCCLEQTYREAGSPGPAFGTIVGSGINSTVLHYRANDQKIDDGSMICIDSGAAYGGYGADITRSVPASGRFTKRQREIYEVVLEAEETAIAAAKPGIPIADLDRVARAVITKAGYGDYFIHSIGHHLGLDTHDITPQGPLRGGNVITIEPGIYIPEEKIGVRIEDDILITKTGNRNLSRDIPKSASEVERAMRSGARKSRTAKAVK